MKILERIKKSIINFIPIYTKEEEKERGEHYYSESELYNLWIVYLDYYNISFQELSRTFKIQYSFPLWLEKIKNSRSNL